jgi:hypothetical protein
MAEHNLFLGGGRVLNLDYAMFPAAAVTASQHLDIATHKAAQFTWLNRILDFTNDVALKDYVARNPTADDVNEVWNAAVIPAGSIVLGHWYRVATPVSGTTLTIRVKNLDSAATTNIATGVNAGTAAVGYVNSGAGLVGLFSFNHYLQVVPTAVPGGGIADLRVEVASLVITPFRGEW